MTNTYQCSSNLQLLSVTIRYFADVPLAAELFKGHKTPPSKRNSINDGTAYVKFATMLITAIISLRLITSIFDGKNYESFGDAFKLHAFSWPQHYNIFLPQDRLDVNDEDDEISTSDI
uniref:Autophagy-related protein n=1 Tax=Elaeophora elaphi TaxID=1147741 RepID=A0A0R3RQU1_9BILA